MTLHLGKQPARYDSRDVRYADIRPKGISLPSFPKPHGGFGRDFPDWLMLGNGPDDTVQPGFPGAGDCFYAGQAHSVMEAEHNAGRPVAPFTGAATIGDYSAGTGYDLSQLQPDGSNPTDKGTDVHEGLARHQQVGIHDGAGGVHQMGPYFSVEPGNFEQMWEVMWLTECLGTGILCPQSAIDQFGNGQEIWTYVPGSPDEGGHWIILVGHPITGVWTGVTWGRRQTMTPPFLSHKCDECFAWIERERYKEVTGQTFEGIKDADLEKYLALVAQRVAVTFG